MTVFRILFAVGMMSFSVALQAQRVCTPENQALLAQELAVLSAGDWAEWSTGEIMTDIGKRWVGRPYVGNTLEVSDGDEALVINLEELDCTTFMENMVVLASLAKQGNLTMEAFEAELTRLRYRDGIRDGYASRLHYTTDWMRNNASMGIVQLITPELSSTPLPRPINFMSTHRSSYAQLADQSIYEEIVRCEEALNQEEAIMLPKAQLAAKVDMLQEGDIIAFTTSIKGLDVVHVGLVSWVNGEAHLLHASTGSNEVELSSKPLVDYLAGKRHMSGVMVARVL